MTSRFDYADYVEAFNRGDDAALIERYFAPDFTFTGATRRYETREAFRDFLQSVHDGIREVIRLVTVLESEDRIFAEIDMDFVASKQRHDFPFGPLEAGEVVTVKFFVLYHLRDGRITELKSMTWPMDYHVSTQPLLGDSPAQRAAFEAYTIAFSAGDGQRFGRFYTDDVVLDLPSGPLLEGRGAIVDFYATMRQRVNEHLTVGQVMFDEHGIAADIVSGFTAHRDAPDFQVAPLRAGESVSVRVFVHYTLRDGRISHIKVARAGQPQRQ